MNDGFDLGPVTDITWVEAKAVYATLQCLQC